MGTEICFLTYTLPSQACSERGGGGLVSRKRCSRLVGTEEYMAPEMILGPTHGFPVDWWSFGQYSFHLNEF